MSRLLRRSLDPFRVSTTKDLGSSHFCRSPWRQSRYHLDGLGHGRAVLYAGPACDLLFAAWLAWRCSNAWWIPSRSGRLFLMLTGRFDLALRPINISIGDAMCCSRVWCAGTRESFGGPYTVCSVQRFLDGLHHALNKSIRLRIMRWW